jgi:isochorismate synthase EntC
LFAGAGVVDGSEPEGELRETQLKLRAMLTPLMEI